MPCDKLLNLGMPSVYILFQCVSDFVCYFRQCCHSLSFVILLIWVECDIVTSMVINKSYVRLDFLQMWPCMEKGWNFTTTRQSSCVTARGVPPAPPAWSYPRGKKLKKKILEKKNWDKKKFGQKKICPWPWPGGGGPLGPWPYPWPGGAPGPGPWPGAPQTMTWGPPGPGPWPGGPPRPWPWPGAPPQTLTWTFTRGAPGPWPGGEAPWTWPWPGGAPPTPWPGPWPGPPLDLDLGGPPDLDLDQGGPPRPWPGPWPGAPPDLDQPPSLPPPGPGPWPGGGPCGQTEILKTLPSLKLRLRAVITTSTSRRSSKCWSSFTLLRTCHVSCMNRNSCKYPFHLQVIHTNSIKYKLLATDTRTFKTFSNELKIHRYFR